MVVRFGCAMARHNVREQIIEAGLKTLLEKGFNACGVRDITDTAGVPIGSFYNHFESKEALGAEIVDRYARESPRRKALKDKTLPPLERLQRHFVGLNQMYADLGYGRGCLLGNFSAELADHSQLIRARLAALSASWTKDIKDAVQEAQADGVISSETDPADLAAFLLDAYEGALLRARIEKSGAPLDRFVAITFARLLA
jgi:TetR/AcrR family transcriptional regulator, transcriptional repressor for nem operon